jgi:calcineurin-like phosphoesterase family protein
MNKEQRIKQTDNCKVYFSSDFHLNHSPKWPIPIWKGRGFESVTEMNDAIIKSINSSVRSTDILFFLGDFVLNCSESQFEEFLSRINCQNIYMLFGNHNSCVWNVYQREVTKWSNWNEEGLQPGAGDLDTLVPICEVYPFRYRNVIFIGNYAEVIVDRRIFVITHYPIHSWNNQKRGSIHLYGHQHCENNPQGGRRMDVGWDRDKRPYSADEIWNKLSNIPILSDGGHH